MKFLAVFRALHRILNHPLGRRDRMGTLARILRWQLGSRLVKAPVAVSWIDGTRLLVSTGMHGATGNFYVGLMEFEDMAFVMHLLGNKDLFFDVGANVGVYSVLAASRGSDVVAIEPIPSTYESLLDNIYINRFHELIEPRNIGVGGQAGALRFSTSMGPTDHVMEDAPEDREEGVDVAVDTLDNIAGGCNEPTMIKVDVEGFEAEVLRGADGVLEKEALQAVLIELNGLGARYSFKDGDVHARLLKSGFKPVLYEPFTRELTALDYHNHSGNTLYVRSHGDLTRRLKEAPVIRWENTEF